MTEPSDAVDTIFLFNPPLVGPDGELIDDSGTVVTSMFATAPVGREIGP